MPPSLQPSLPKRANLIPQDLVKCLVMALSDQTWVPCPLLESPMQLCGLKVGAVAPQRKLGVLLPIAGHADIEQGSRWLPALRHCDGQWGWGPAEPGNAQPPGAPRSVPRTPSPFETCLFLQGPCDVAVGNVGGSKRRDKKPRVWAAAPGPKASCRQSRASHVGSCSVALPFLPSLPSLPPVCLLQMPLGHAQYRSWEYTRDQDTVPTPQALTVRTRGR